jgi:hypothetical protein
MSKSKGNEALPERQRLSINKEMQNRKDNSLRGRNPCRIPTDNNAGLQKIGFLLWIGSTPKCF